MQIGFSKIFHRLPFPIRHASPVCFSLYRTLLILALVGTFSTAKASDNRLQTADSLFDAKKYTEAFQQYKNLLSGGVYSPQMLLKMAYVKEALNDYTQALYYLNLSYYYHPSKEVLQKMEALANEHGLYGYEFSDYEYVASVYHEYKQVIFVFGSLLLVLGIGLLYWLRKRDSHLLFPTFALVFFAFLFAIAINFGFPLSHAVLSGDKAFLMEAPSAGSKLLETVSTGHRVEVLSREDIWYKVRWQEKEAFVRESNLLIVQ